MSIKTRVLALSPLVLCMQTACVAKDMTATCSVTGAKYLSAEMSEGEICGAFRERLGKTLAAAEGADTASDISIAIELHKRGSLEARITSEADDGAESYPVVGVDVMDRSMAAEDLDRLADAVAQLLLNR